MESDPGGSEACGTAACDHEICRYCYDAQARRWIRLGWPVLKFAVAFALLVGECVDDNLLELRALARAQEKTDQHNAIRAEWGLPPVPLGERLRDGILPP